MPYCIVIDMYMHVVSIVACMEIFLGPNINKHWQTPFKHTI